MATKKVVDTWKSKSWYSVHAPKFLNEVEVAQIPALDDEHMLNRIIQIPLKDITKDLSHVYTNVKLRVSEIKGKSAYAKFIGHEVSREYIHALVRRRMDALNAVFSVTSKDGIEFRIKAVVLTGVSCSGTQKRALRNGLTTELKRIAESKTFGEFIYDTLFGKTSAEIYRLLRTIAPLKRVEIRKTELKEVFDTPEIRELPSDALEEEKKVESKESTPDGPTDANDSEAKAEDSATTPSPA
ncbi:30S ribosomal protein S3ae [Candidatus Micrarchaeota archaeon]|nr:30S ribosomal protein S3ae [Candidatus Micrarchaeota archaeon]